MTSGDVVIDGGRGDVEGFSGPGARLRGMVTCSLGFQTAEPTLPCAAREEIRLHSTKSYFQA